MHHFVAKSHWSDEAVLAAMRAPALPIITQRGPILALIIDDTGIPEKGKHSVGVARQRRPLPITTMIPLMILRSSTGGTLCDSEKYGSIRRI